MCKTHQGQCPTRAMESRRFGVLRRSFGFGGDEKWVFELIK
ncbi:hypothetical protein M7I_5313 [Glarea lozoyensis 74030]|uniref:Uncharacterized protein n=1 Tax=Glarea lozoyensis (strain ATCC 74030 / MF5533) TaxID=1104152 RepID=H0ERJ4_GLAL7|nr:hypothetical protein M7I_5313 [Glarea lozoyensis 74030]